MVILDPKNQISPPANVRPKSQKQVDAQNKIHDLHCSPLEDKAAPILFAPKNKAQKIKMFSSLPYAPK